MAFINCPECKRSISTLAEYCPHCGCPKKYFSLMSLNEPRPDLLYCRVVFASEAHRYDARTYYYISDDPSVKCGDIAIVRTGKYSEEKRVIVKSTILVKQNDVAPYPPEKTKHLERIERKDESRFYLNRNNCPPEDGEPYPHEPDPPWTDADWMEYTGGETMEEFFDHEPD